MDNDGPNARHQHSPEEVEYRRVELITGRRRRRDWTPDEKAEILSACVAPGSKVAEVARRYGLNSNMLFTWRRRERAVNDVGKTVNIVPVRVVVAVPPSVKMLALAKEAKLPS